MRLYGEISKVEELEDGTIRVSGIASSESVDASKEVILASAMRKALPDYMTFGAIREMHDAHKAAGTAIQCEVQDDGKTYLEALVVDPIAIKKVQTGVYKGFSVGGHVVDRDPLNKRIITGLTLTEISLVDRPCNPDAIMSIAKIGGQMNTEDIKKMLGQEVWDTKTALCALEGIMYLISCESSEPGGEPEQVALLMEAAEKLKAFIASEIVEDHGEEAEDGMQKVAPRKDVNPKEGESKYGDVEFADEKNKKYPIDTEEHIRAAWNYINKPANAGKYSSEDAKKIKAKIVAAWKKKIDKDGPPSAEETKKGDGTMETLTKRKKELAELHKAVMSAHAHLGETLKSYHQAMMGDSEYGKDDVAYSQKEDANKEDVKKKDTKEEDSNKEDSKKEDSKKEDSKKEDTMKEDVKKGMTSEQILKMEIESLRNEIKALKSDKPLRGVPVSKSDDTNAHPDSLQKRLADMAASTNPLDQMKLALAVTGRPGFSK